VVFGDSLAAAALIAVADAPRLSLLRVKAASEDTSASGDELIEELKAKVRVLSCPLRTGASVLRTRDVRQCDVPLTHMYAVGRR
jgi:hypothetical protein